MRSASHRRFFVPRCPRPSAHGQATVEFALVVVLLMVMILSMLELILLMHTYNVLADAAKEGVRYAEVHGTGNSKPSGPHARALILMDPPCPWELQLCLAMAAA